MGPDIQWRVGESAGQETIIKATPPRRSRRSWIAIVIVVLLGVGLGLAYRAIPEPAPRPTPLPSPTPRATSTYPAIPAKLYATIDREAQALADGDLQAYLKLHTYEDTNWTQQFTSTFRAWQRPANDQPLYSIIHFDQRTATTASVDIRQFRNGRSFHETRFYVWEKDRWLRREVDPYFWNGRTEIIDTPHFHVIYFTEDRDFIQPVIDQLEQAQDKLCVDLGCDAVPLTYTLRLTSYSTSEWSISGNGHEMRFASPRVMGVYEDGTPLGEEGLNLIWPLAWTTGLQRAYGQLSVTEDRAGILLLLAISRRAAMRAIGRPDIESLPKLKASLTKRPLPLEMLWNGPTERYDPAIIDLAYATIYFIEQEYGAQSMPRLLSALGNAQSLADAVENGLGVPFAEFDQKWQAWVKYGTP